MKHNFNRLLHNTCIPKIIFICTYPYSILIAVAGKERIYNQITGIQ